MPRYCYQCDECDMEFQIRHSMKETLTECPDCEAEGLVRVLPHVRYNNGDKKEAVGSLVKRSIEDAKEAMKEEMKESSKEYKS